MMYYRLVDNLNKNYERGIEAFENGKHQEAEAHFTRAINSQKIDRDSTRKVGNCYWYIGIMKESSNDDAIIVDALKYYVRAIKVYKEALKLEEYVDIVYYNLALTFNLVGLIRADIDSSKEPMMGYPNPSSKIYNPIFYFKKGKEFCEEAIKRGNEIQSKNLAYYYTDYGLIQDNIRLFQGMKNSFQTNIEPVDYNSILNCFNRALFKDNDSYRAWYYKGLILHNLRRYDGAIECYAKTLAILEDASKDQRDNAVINAFISNVHNDYGNALYNIGRYEEAENQYQKALENTSNYFRKRVYVNLAWCVLKLGNLIPADSYVDHVLLSYDAKIEDKINDNDLKQIDKLPIESKRLLIRALYIKGFVSMRKDLWQAALTYTDNSILLMERYSRRNNFLKDPVAFHYRGTILYQKESYSDAIENYKKALEINPLFAEAEDSLGVAFTKRKKDYRDIEDAFKHIEKAVEIRPNLTTAQQHYIQIQSIRKGMSITGVEEGPRFIKFWSSSWQRGAVAFILVTFAFLLTLYSLNLFSPVGLPSTDFTEIANFTEFGKDKEVTTQTRTSTYSFILIIIIAIIILSPDIQRAKIGPLELELQSTQQIEHGELDLSLTPSQGG